jgi:hypothetical protein
MVNRREVKKARELMVRFGNCADMARLYPQLKKQINKEAKRYFDKVVAKPREVVEVAAEELNAKEASYRVGRI